MTRRDNAEAESGSSGRFKKSSRSRSPSPSGRDETSTSQPSTSTSSRIAPASNSEAEQAPSPSSAQTGEATPEQLPQLEKLLQNSRGGGEAGLGSSPVGTSGGSHHGHRHHHAHRRRQLANQRLMASTTAQRIEAESRNLEGEEWVEAQGALKEMEEAEEEARELEEAEDLLEYYLQRAAATQSEAERLLAGARDLEESIGVSSSARRFEVNRLELTLSIAGFAASIGAMISSIFGMNLKSTLEESVLGFWGTTAAIILGCALIFWALYGYTRRRRIL